MERRSLKWKMPLRDKYCQTDHHHHGCCEPVLMLEPGDPPVLQQPLQTSKSGIQQIIECFRSGTKQLKHILLKDVDTIFECKLCRSLFRGLPNLITHKKFYCPPSLRMDDNSPDVNDKQSQAISDLLEAIYPRVDKQDYIIRLEPIETNKNAVFQYVSKVGSSVENTEMNVPSDQAAVEMPEPTTEPPQAILPPSESETIHIPLPAASNTVILTSEDASPSSKPELKCKNNYDSGHQLICCLCKKEFHSRRSVRRHIRKVHKKKIEELKKFIEIKKRPNQTSGRGRNKNVLVTLGKSCPVCFKSFATKANVRRHFDEVHRGLRRDSITLDIATRPGQPLSLETASAKKSLKTQNQKSSSKAEYNLTACKCLLCKRKYSSQIMLKKHMQIVHKITLSTKNTKKEKKANNTCNTELKVKMESIQSAESVTPVIVSPQNHVRVRNHSNERKNTACTEKKNTPSAEKKSVFSAEKKNALSSERKSTSVEKKTAPLAERKSAPSTERKNASSIERKNTPSSEKKSAPSAERKSTPSAERKSASSAERKSTASAERKGAPSAEKKSATSTEKKSVTSAARKRAASAEKKSAVSAARKRAASAGEKNAASVERKSVASTKRKSVASTERKSVASAGKKSTASAERKSAVSVEKKSVASAEKKSAASTERKRAASAEIKSVASAEKKGAVPAEKKGAAPAERKSAPSSERKKAPSTEKKRAPSTEKKSAAAKKKRPSTAEKKSTPPTKRNKVNHSSENANPSNQTLAGYPKKPRKPRLSVGFDFKKLYCKLCKRQFTSKQNLTKHIELHTDGSNIYVKFYKCPLCTYETRRKRDVIRHITVVHKKSSRYLGKITASLEIRAIKKPIDCVLNKVAKRGPQRDEGKENGSKEDITSNSPSKKYEGADVGIEVKVTKNFSLHTCNKCGKAFAKKTFLELHKKTHKANASHPPEENNKTKGRSTRSKALV